MSFTEFWDCEENNPQKEYNKKARPAILGGNSCPIKVVRFFAIRQDLLLAKSPKGIRIFLATSKNF